MKILVACEESQRVCLAFRKYGHEAYSCDIEFCSGGYPEYHIWADVEPLLNGKCVFRTCDGKEHNIDRWDMIIAFPPCTFLTKAGSVNLFKGGNIDENRLKLGQQAALFFLKIYNADCDKICIENPVPIKIFNLPDYSQVVEPYYFGVPVSKKTYLWLKGLTYLCPTKYYLSLKKIYSERFSTDCYSDFYTNKVLKSELGLIDIPEYSSVKPTFEELKNQNSYFINDLINKEKNL